MRTAWHWGEFLGGELLKDLWALLSWEVNMQRPNPLFKPPSLDGQVMKRVKVLNYPGIERGCSLSFSQNADTVCEKPQHGLLVESLKAAIHDWCAEPLFLPAVRIHRVQVHMVQAELQTSVRKRILTALYESLIVSVLHPVAALQLSRVSKSLLVWKPKEAWCNTQPSHLNKRWHLAFLQTTDMFTFLYVQSFLFNFQFYVVTALWLNSDTKPHGQGLKKIMFWIKIPRFVGKNLGGKYLDAS